MKAIILTLAVAGFMSTAHAGVHKKANDFNLNNAGPKPCEQHAGSRLNESTNPRVAQNNSTRSTTRSQKGTN